MHHTLARQSVFFLCLCSRLFAEHSVGLGCSRGRREGRGRRAGRRGEAGERTSDT
ncbi:hypothetical protein E2C01_082436 [Portunus trituberculatus]|uniref:Uncharacterized protein n=1 Tax=Portunus trituberculatus TaxID=210409 RepID=A0A5B7ISC6_PORTR|nr:hypothetical protein [Portunus trituberculatus]